MSTEFVTGTGERYRRRGRYVDVGLSQSAQDALGTALLFAPVSIGAKVCAGEHLFVLEGDKAAAEFYAPFSGYVVSAAEPDASASEWLLTLRISGD